MLDFSLRKAFFLTVTISYYYLFGLNRNSDSPGKINNMQTWKAVPVELDKRTKRQFCCEKLFTRFSLVMALFTARASLMVSPVPGVM